MAKAVFTMKNDVFRPPTPNFQKSFGNAFTLNTGGSHRSKSAFSTPYGVEIQPVKTSVTTSILWFNTGLADSFFSAAAGF